MADMTVATTILEQLGGKRFKLMTGAHSFIGGDTYLMFALPRVVNEGKAYTSVKMIIALEPSDEYTVKLIRVRNFESKDIDIRGSIYAEDLQRVFTSMTGLETRL